MKKHKTMKREITKFVISKNMLDELMIEMLDVAKNTNNEKISTKMNERVLQLETMMKEQKPDGYVWSDPYEGGCFVYEYEDHPVDAIPVFVGIN
jgi:hypothetical protein